MFNHFANIYFEEKEDSVKKIKRTYEIHIEAFIGKLDVAIITTDDIKKIQKLKKIDLAEKTVNAIIQIIGAIYTVAISKKLFAKSNPISGQIKRIKVDNASERYLQLDEIKLLIQETKCKDHLYVFTLLALQTGGRLGTILSLCKKYVKL
ncbi:MAG: hypothetical protein HRT40_11110 [Campylobacteraceae bacterium]|nr:hypothetical protein [Campylobacteraceae bacterium]